MRLLSLMVFFVIICLQAVSVCAGGPRLAFAHEATDLGRVPQGQEVAVRFPLTNAGDGTLVVQGVQADCACTETLNGSPEVPPQGHSEIVAVLNTARLTPGRNEKHIHVRCNDPQRPNVTLTMVVEVIP
jgi:hypothetical protein